MTERFAELRRSLQENDTERAETLCRELLKAEPDNVELLTLSGVLARGRGDLAGALEQFERALKASPETGELHNNAGVVLEALGRHAEAAQRYREALSLNPCNPQALVNLGNALGTLGDAEGAIASYSDAIALDPSYADAYFNLGGVLRGTGEWQGAVQCYRKVLELDPGRIPGYVNLAGSLLALNLFDEAVATVRRGLAVEPEGVDLHWNLALALLVKGEYREGWREYEWRLKDPSCRFETRFAGKDSWDGSPLSGRTLLIRAEQGFGDAIQFYRYAQLLSRRGEKVVLECRRELLPLLAAQEGGVDCFAAGEKPPPFDTFTYLLSLPHLLGTELATIPPQEPPTRPAPAEVTAWRERIPEGGLNCGLVWAGSAGYKNDRNRSLVPSHLAPLAALPGVRLFSLQMGGSPAELAAIGGEGTICDLAPGIRHFGDTAAILENLDLVVAVDTAVAHLAAAMGKPVFLMLPFSCDWRWLSERSDSPWYPSARLFRQGAPGDWGGVVEAIAKDLRDYRDLRDLRDLRNDGEEPQALFARGNALRAAGDPSAAAAAYRELLARLPGCAEAHNNLGLALEDLGLKAEAEESFRSALKLRPDLADGHNNLGALLVSLSRHEEAADCFRRALEADPGCLPAYANLGSCLQVMERPEEAVECYREAIGRDPSFLEARINLGNALQELMRPQEAIAAYREVLSLAPNHPEAHWNQALSLLSTGDFEAGWREYEWRLAGCEERNLPAWRGEELSGRTILVECEQGLGDTLQFARYATLLAEKGGRVVVECQLPGLKPLLGRVPGVAEVFSRGEPPPRCDCRVRLLSLPHLFGTTVERMPPWRPYLLAEQRRAALWELLLEAGGDLKVGLVWRGGPLPRNRACPFENFAPLATLSGVSFYSLQLGEAPDPSILPAADVSGQIGDFGDTAAILAGLDLLITVDTAAAHLAGGMGVPVWLMLPWSCDWRWFTEGETSPWYPTMRLFRQRQPGDWPGVVGRLKGELEAMINCR